MFTGIVSDVGKVVSVAEGDRVRHVRIESAYDADTIEIGASIACAGICLTVTSCASRPGGGLAFQVDLAPETARLTTSNSWVVGTPINLERSLRIGDEVGGHLVSGHIDGIARIVSRDELGEATRVTFEAPAELARFIAPKGSIALDGTSLTINGVTGNQFDCLLIPHTLTVTTWSARQQGDEVNLEVDQIARYVARFLEASAPDIKRKD